VDRSSADPESLAHLVEAVPGVRSTRRVRSRDAGGAPTVDVVVTVDAQLPTRDAHAIADAIERTLFERVGARDVTVHIEPHAGAPRPPQRR
jgi:divalent metal cation (Fe/Co/Zn/Cd) transporter